MSKPNLIEVYKNEQYDPACVKTTTSLKQYTYTKNEISEFANMYGDDLPDIVHLMILAEIYDLQLCGLTEKTWHLMNLDYHWFYRQHQYDGRLNKGIGPV
jgi:hypothetical protein